MAERKYISRIALKNGEQLEPYLRELPAVQRLLSGEPLSFSSDVTFFVGENGTGKSTLLEAIAVACGFNAEGGSRSFDFSTSRTHSNLYERLVVSRQAYPKDGFFLRAESFYNAATYIDRLDEEVPGLTRSYGGVSLHRQSHGESFFSLVQNRFGGKGLYLLDEPEAALSPMRQMAMLVQIDELKKRQSQFIIATHSPILMAYPDAQVLLFSEEGIREVSYRETEHYQLSRRFLEDPERMLDILLNRKSPV